MKLCLFAVLFVRDRQEIAWRGMQLIGGCFFFEPMQNEGTFGIFDISIVFCQGNK